MMNRQTVTLAGLAAVSIATVFAMRGADAQTTTFVQEPGRGAEYARLEIAGEDAILFLNGSTRFIEGPERRIEQPMEGNRQFWAVTPYQIIHLNALGREGWRVVGPPDPDASAFLLVRGG